MYNKKNITSLVILCVFISQIVFTNIFSLSANAAETVSESVYSGQTIVESNIIGDVNGDGQINSVDFALMRMVLLGARSSFPITNGAWASDTDGNGIFNSIDFAIMRKLLLGIINIFPAEANTKGNPFNYALFSGDTKNDLELNGQGIKIYGDIHSNSSINIYSNDYSYIRGNCSAVKQVNISGIRNDYIKEEGKSIIYMPDFSEYFRVKSIENCTYFSERLSIYGDKYCPVLEDGQFKDKSFDGSGNLKISYYNGGNEFDQTWVINGDKLILQKDKPLFFDGNVILVLNGISGNGFIVATGDITLNLGSKNALGLKYKVNGTVDLENSAEIGVYSTDGNIELNMSGIEFKGLLYAPGSIEQSLGGRININSSDIKLYGSMVAHQLNKGIEQDITFYQTSLHNELNNYFK